MKPRNGSNKEKTLYEHWEIKWLLYWYSKRVLPVTVGSDVSLDLLRLYGRVLTGYEI